ncbi:transcription factor E2F6-like, partial [Plectropomus leopardus]|uniref:transcription factor E2F6-like n=1 Tax=Plectropomus leopardus TaxID=160734 RepID=UPI001C4D65D4
LIAAALEPGGWCLTLVRVVLFSDVSLGLLTLRFLELLLASPDGAVDLRDVPARLQTGKRRVYDITHVLTGIKLIQKDSVNWVKWIGKSPISSFLWKNPQRLRRELDDLKVLEDKLDTLIKSCARQLFDMTDDVESSEYPLQQTEVKPEYISVNVHLTL